MPTWTFGRDPDCDVTLSADSVSFHHCRLTREGDSLLLEDLNSSNGTWVNGERISQTTPVKPADKILLGGTVEFPWPDDALPAADANKPRDLATKKKSSTRPAKPPASPPPAEQRPMTVQSRVPSTILKTGGEITIGRDPESDIVLQAEGVSWNHAKVVIGANGKRVLEDAGSSNGTYVNKTDNRIEQAEIKSGDVIYFGNHPVPAERLLNAVPGASKVPPLPERPVALTVDRPMVVGRDPECDRVLDHPMVSWQHAKITSVADGFRVEDLGSTNGTFLNGKRVTKPTTARDGDVVAIASFSITLSAGGQVETVDSRGRFSVEARDITVDVPGKRLLENISLTIHPGEFVGLMGPSGAGKSTLMNALNGYVPPSAGAVFISRRNLYEQYDMFRGQIGYVPQDDIMHGDLTVGEALFYTARLRLPPDFSTREIRERIATVLNQLGLQGTENVLIGSPERKGISGGQRKRVNLAMELLTDPSILFLDEPTSGLSSEDALMVMKVLRQLADAGKTILLTIHQPSPEVYRLMDHLVVVAKDAGSDVPGCLAWYGPAFPDAIRFFNPESSKPAAKTKDAAATLDLSPEGVLRGLAKAPAVKWKSKYRGSGYFTKFVTSRSSRASVPPLPAKKRMRRQLGIRQAWTLFRRGLTIRLRDRANTILLMAQAPYIALLIMLVFGGDARQTVDDESWPSVMRATSMTCFLLGLSALWCGCSNAVREIVGEWAIYRRERMVNLKLPSYIASKFVVLIGLSAIQCGILLLMAYFANGLKGPIVAMFIVLLLAAAVGIAIGLVVSALSRTSEFAVTMLPVVILPMIMLGGALQPIEKMNGFVRVCSAAIPVRWTFESLLLLEADERKTWSPPVPPAPVARTPASRRKSDGRSRPAPVKKGEKRDMAEEFFPTIEEDYRTSVVAGVAILTAMLIALLGLVAFLLSRRDIH